ncbi:MAG: hypothetical protein JWQ35_1067 [Bacteriovoracaceae bacterium]|nr:hypothetical protein [Bacteriovoracaceae bacterium]
MKPLKSNFISHLLTISLGMQIYLFSSSLADAADQKTYAEKTLLQKNELIIPQRMTVGPNDNFQTAVSSDSKSIFFTGSTHLAERIFIQDIRSGFSRSFIDDKTDSKDPSLSPDGKTLAYTSFRHDARGDICIQSLSDKKEKCITGKDSEDRSPFWIGSQKIGFLTRRWIEEPYSIGVLSLDHLDQKPKILFLGDIADPVCSKEVNGSRWLAYTKIINGRTTIEVRSISEAKDEITTSERISFSVDLPGLSSFPQFDSDGEYLYFGQYTSDTNRDFQVDGRDKSALYRIRLKDILNKAEGFPEPLSSIEYNCNYPSPHPSGLFVTCASPDLTGDGSLDIYRLPLSGMIPESWNEKKILRGIETARSYSDRILLYYSLMSKFPQYRKNETLEKVLSNYIIDGQLASAIFYAQKLESKKAEGNYYKLLEILLTAELKAKQERDGSLSSTFRSFIDEELKKVNALHSSEPAWNSIVSARLLLLAGRNADANHAIATNKAQTIKSPLVLYYYSQVLRSLGKETELSLLESLAQSDLFTESAQVYYSYEFLRQIDAVYQKKDEAGRLRYLNETKNKLTKKNSSLAHLIDLDLELAGFKSDDIKNESNQKVYAELLKNISEEKPHYFLYRAMLVRSVLTFSKKSFWNYMYFISSTWLNVASTEYSEYSSARRQFLSIGLEKAYGRWGAKEYSYAGDQFSITSRLTDDLEAHHGFIRSRLIENKKKDIDDMYKSLKKDGYIGENLIYVSALLTIFDYQGAHPNEIDEKLFKSNLESLEKMSVVSFNPALRFYLMGYLSHKLFEAKIRAGDQDSENFEKSERYYMLALDLSRDNERVVSNLLFNLAMLHQLAENHGQSLTFFELRKTNIFEDLEEKAAFNWYYGKSFFYNLQPANALAVTEAFLKEKEVEKKYPEFYEKAAFYAAQANDFQKSKKYYETFFQLEPHSLSDRMAPDWIRIQMGYGYALFKLKRSNEARSVFEKIMELNSLSNSEKQVGKFLPLVQYQLLALGFLAQLETNKTEKIHLLSRRFDLYKKQGGNLDQILIKKEDWLKTLLTIQNQIAETELDLNNSNKAMEELSNSLSIVSDLRTTTGNSLDRVDVMSLTNYFAAAVALKERDPSFRSKDLGKALELGSTTHLALQPFPELKSAPEYDAFEKYFLKIKSSQK